MANRADLIVCPFCKEDDFDLIGLKAHLLRDCEPFQETISPMEDILRRRDTR